MKFGTRSCDSRDVRKRSRCAAERFFRWKRAHALHGRIPNLSKILLVLAGHTETNCFCLLRQRNKIGASAGRDRRARALINGGWSGANIARCWRGKR
jgi:hypothetical protein